MDLTDDEKRVLLGLVDRLHAERDLTADDDEAIRLDDLAWWIETTLGDRSDTGHE